MKSASKLNRILRITIPAMLLAQAALAQTDIHKLIDKSSTSLTSIMGLLLVLATVVFLWGVIRFIAAAEDPRERAKGKSIMALGLVGLTIIACAWGLVAILVQYFGVTETPAPLPPAVPI